MTTCRVKGCKTKVLARCMCHLHYYRWLKNGHTDKIPVPSGKQHYAWNETPSYNAMHRRLRIQLGPASKYPCWDCGGQAIEWSYDHADPNELTQVTKNQRGFSVEVAYSTDPDHYSPLCHPCHTAFDLRAKQLHNAA